MIKRFIGILLISMVVASLIGCAVGSSPSPMVTEAVKQCDGPALSFGEISDDPNEVTTSLQPFANYLAEKLTSLGYECSKVKVVDTVDEMITLIKNGEVDIYMDSMYPAMLVSDALGTQPILRRWRNCDPDYYSVIFSTQDSGITTVEELAGHMIAMDQIYSTSGFVLPAVYLIDYGLTLALKDSYNEPVAQDEIGIFFSYDDKNTLNLVLEGKVSAGATDDYFYNKWETETQEQEPPIHLVKLAQTSSLPRQVVVVRPNLGSDVKSAIKNEMLNVHLNPEGLSVLKQAADTCSFDEPTDGIETTFAQIQQMHSKIMGIPGWQEAFFNDR